MHSEPDGNYGTGQAWFARVTALGLALTPACTDALPLGSNIIWTANHETGDTSQWSSDGSGGTFVTDAESRVLVVSEQTHGGHFSVKLTSSVAAANAGAGLFRHRSTGEDAYFSAWYLLPRAYQTTSYWTIFRFQPAAPTDATTTALGIDVNLRSLPEGQMVLYVLQQRPDYLQWPLADPAPYVPVGRWFQIEALYRNATDNTGRLKIWLDGSLVYDIENRITGLSEGFYWSLCNVTSSMTPTPVDIYVDDAAISRSRVSIDGIMGLP